MNKEETKKEKIDSFINSLVQEDSGDKYPFTVICSKCGSNNVTIYHGCEYYCYSSYTAGIDNNCGLKCKDCGNACTITNW